ncbi:MAG: hypothetical protein H8E94_08240 [Alphaproteobacteria bacterium]|nr:hypothetical protein [Alphaproteobacteria bacterium]
MHRGTSPSIVRRLNWRLLRKCASGWLAVVAILVQGFVPLAQGIPSPWDLGDKSDPRYVLVCTCLGLLDPVDLDGGTRSAGSDPSKCPVAQALLLGATSLIPNSVEPPVPDRMAAADTHIPAAQRTTGKDSSPFRPRAPPVA